MHIIRGVHNLASAPAALKGGCVATIGNFDGVHLGHQAIMRQVIERATALNIPSVVITFEPQPREFFSPDDAPARLTRFREKLEAIASCGIDMLLCLPFNRKLSALTSGEFVEQILVDGLAIKHLVVGDDFQFGKGRKGNFESLVAAGEHFDFAVENTTTYSIDDERVSSTRIRHALMAGDLSLVERLMERPYRMSGHVQHGDKRGRTIGFPTANIAMHRLTPAIKGVYAVHMSGGQLPEGGVHGIANIGNRPTVDGKRTLLEVHLLDYQGDLYGQMLNVDFMTKIRDEKKFDSFDDLKNQIHQDEETAREFFSHL